MKKILARFGLVLTSVLLSVFSLTRTVKGVSTWGHSNAPAYGTGPYPDEIDRVDFYASVMIKTILFVTFISSILYFYFKLIKKREAKSPVKTVIMVIGIALSLFAVFVSYIYFINPSHGSLFDLFPVFSFVTTFVFILFFLIYVLDLLKITKNNVSDDKKID